MKKITYIFIILSIIFNYKIKEFNDTSIYLNSLIQMLFLYIFSIYFLFVKRNGNIQKFERNGIEFIDVTIIIFLIYLVSGIRDAEGLVVFITLFMFIIFYFVFRILINQYRGEVFLLLISISITIKDLIYLSSYKINTLDIHNRINVDAMGNFNNYSYINVLSLITIYYLYSINIFNKKIKKILLVSAVINLIMIIILFSRGGWITLIIILLINIPFLFKNRNIYFLYYTIIPIVIFYFINLEYDLFSKVITRFSSLLSDQGTGRLWIWDNLLNMMYEKNITEFLFGSGLGNFYFWFFDKPFDSAHNFFLEIIYENGIVGFGLFILILIVLYSNIRKLNNISYMFSLSVLVIFTLSNLFDSHIYIIQTNWIYGMYLAYIVCISTNNKIRR